MTGRTGAASLYRIGSDGNLTEVLAGRTISNGLAWVSSTESRYIDSAHSRIFSLSWPAQPDAHPNLSVFVELDPGDEPDGLTISPSGEVLVALWRGSRIARFAPSGGRLADIEVPANFPTSVALGGAEEEIMVVTSAAHREAGVQPRDSDGAVFVRYCNTTQAEESYG